MAEKKCTECGKKLRDDNTSGVCGDRTACRARAAGDGKASPAAAASPARAPRKVPAAKKPKGREELALELYELDELVALRAAVTAELRKRKEQAEAELEKLREFVG